MVSIGRVLMAEASLYLVDEPSLGLAPKIGKGVIDALMGIDLAHQPWSSRNKMWRCSKGASIASSECTPAS